MKNMIVLMAALVLSFITFPKANAASMRDSIGKLKPGVYRVSTGTHYVSWVYIEIFNDGDFRLQLRPGGEMTAITQNLLLTGRLVEDHAQRTTDGFQSFDLRVEHVYQVTDKYIGLWHPELVNTMLEERSKATVENIHISLNLGSQPRMGGIYRQQTALIETNWLGLDQPPVEFEIFRTRTFEPRPYSSESEAVYSRFDAVLKPNPSATFKSCEGMFRAAL